MKISKLIAVAVLAGLSNSLVSADTPVRNEWQERAFREGCDKNQLNTNLCSEYDYQVLDAKLNDLYRQQLARLSEASRKRLIASERAWLKYVEADCLYQIGPREESGTIWPYEQNVCLSEHTTERIKLLQAYLNCTHNGCPE